METGGSGLDDAFRKLAGSELLILLEKLGRYFDEKYIEAYLVGGWVRDILLGRDTADIDIAVDSDAFDIALNLARLLNGTYVPLDEENRVARVILPGAENMAGLVKHWQLDFSTFKSTIRQDLSRRDFTFNSMAVSLNRLEEKVSGTIKIIDPFKGRRDLQQGIVRAVSDSVFSSDPVRLLRAARLAAELGFKIDEHTESLIKRDASLVQSVAGERIREELVRLLDVFGAGPMQLLDRLGLLVPLIPELADTKGVGQPPEHHWDVFEHSVRMVAAVDYLLRRGSWEFGGPAVLAAVPWSKTLAEHFEQEVGYGSTRRTLLKLAALLHDISKPQTRAVEENGRIRFLGHPVEGAATAVRILERLRFSGREIKVIEAEVAHHMRPTQMSNEGLPTNKAVYRFFRDTGDSGIDILFLNLADHLAARGPGLILDAWQEHARLVEYVINKRIEQEKVVNPPKIIDGYDIIKFFRVTPGPEIGEMLELVREAQASGEIKTREEALSFISERLKKNNV